MAKKLDTTPDGIVCSCCGVDKTPQNFFRYINRYTRDFFVAGIPARSDVCFDCAGDYKCIRCNVVQPSTEFRIQGRVCYTCQHSNPARRTPVAPQKPFARREAVLSGIEVDNGANESEYES